MSETIFNQETPPAVVDNTSTSTLPQEVSEFVGVGKKYSSVEDALKSVPHAQKHIQTLEQELTQMKEELAKRKTAEDLLDEIKSGMTTQGQPPSVEINQDKLIEVVNKTLEQRQIQDVYKQNVSKVITAFNEKFLDKAPEVYTALAKEAGMSVEMLNNLAATSPQAVLKLAGFNEKHENAPAKIHSNVNTEGTTITKGNDMSARVPKGASTKDLVSAWKTAGEKVKQTQIG